MLVSLSSKGELPTAGGSSSGKTSSNGDTWSNGIPLLASLLDIGMLKFQDRDRLVDVFKTYRRLVK